MIVICRQELLVPVAGQMARVPFPMPEEDFDLLLATLNLWRRKLVEPKPHSAPATPETEVKAWLEFGPPSERVSTPAVQVKEPPDRRGR